MRKNILFLLLFLAAALGPMGAEEKPSSALGPELTATESRQLDRISDLYTEVAQQIAETQARLKVLSEMHQKLAADFQTFQANVIATRGYKPGQATLDVQMRKVMPVPAQPEGSSAGSGARAGQPARDTGSRR